MASEKTNIVHLLQRYKQGDCTEDELRQLHLYVSADHDADALNEALSTSLLEAGDEPQLKEEKLNQLYRAIAAKTTQAKVRRHIGRAVWIYAAASILLAALVSLYFYSHVTESGRDKTMVVETDLAPGGNRATLTLADGRVVKLSEQRNGIVMRDQIRYDDGAAVLDDDNLRNVPTNPATAVSYQLATPRGGTYQITLPDGTKVWLNAESILTYPTHFDGDERIVTLSGEGYFAVARDERKTFKVIANGQQVDVLGTEFNISAYADAGDIRTTLVKGRVSVGSAEGHATGVRPVVLNPGQQAQNTGAGEIVVHDVNVTPYISWKDGIFYFDETKLVTAMNQLSRWYDVEISYQGQIPDTHFYGEISRNKTLKEVLDILMEGGVRFRIEKEGDRNKLIVLPR